MISKLADSAPGGPGIEPRDTRRRGEGYSPSTLDVHIAEFAEQSP